MICLIPFLNLIGIYAQFCNDNLEGPETVLVLDGGIIHFLKLCGMNIQLSICLNIKRMHPSLQIILSFYFNVRT